MDVTCLTFLFILTLIYHVLSNNNHNNNISSPANNGFQPCPHDPTKCLPGNITVTISSTNNCSTDMNMTCATNLPPKLIDDFMWEQDHSKLAGQNQSILVQKITTAVNFTCTVLSPCGNFSSSYKLDCLKHGSAIGTTTVLLVCGVGAILVILMFGMTMKIMQKKDEARRRDRRPQRQAMPSNDSSTTAISYW